MHFTPTCISWINQEERLFAYVTTDLPQRADHRSVPALEADLRAWVKTWNHDPKPFIWTKTADQILTSVARLLQRTSGAGHELAALLADRAEVMPFDWLPEADQLATTTVEKCCPDLSRRNCDE